MCDVMPINKAEHHLTASFIQNLITKHSLKFALHLVS